MTESIRNIATLLACLNLICGVAYASIGFSTNTEPVRNQGIAMICIAAVLGGIVLIARKLQRG